MALRTTSFARIATIAAVLGVFALTAASANAAQVLRIPYDHTDSFVDPDVCAAAPWGFDVFATEHEYGFVEVYLDSAGDFVRATIHNNYDATISANGKTIFERDTWNIFVAPGEQRDAGLTVHIQGPSGIVVRDAGQIVWNPDGTVSYTRGPHEQLTGVSFCPALVA